MKIILKKSKTSEPFTFAFVDSEAKLVVRSENYRARKSALNGIESVKKNSLKDARYEMKETKNGRFFFNIKASNGQVVGTSAHYVSILERSNAIANFKAKAPNAPVEEQQG